MRHDWLARALRAAPTPAAGSIDARGEIGVEHEFALATPEGPLDFRTIVDGLALDGQRLDPGDRWSTRCRAGFVITCDGPEAEVVTPPLPLTTGFAGGLAAWSLAGRGALRAALPPDVTLSGYSTHLNVGQPLTSKAHRAGPAATDLAEIESATARFAATYGIPLLLLTGRHDTPGIQVRPRHGRTELVVAHCDDGQLRAVATFAAGSVLALRRGLAPPAVAVATEPCVIRYGAYLDRSGVRSGIDVLAAGRSAELELAAGGAITADAHLALAWSTARETLGDVADPVDVAAVDALVDGSASLPCERGDERPVEIAPDERLGGDLPGVRDLLTERRRPRRGDERIGEIVVTPYLATWDYVVFRVGAFRVGASSVASRPRAVFACIPRAAVDAFLDQLDAGVLDRGFAAELRRPDRGRVLEVFSQTRQPGVFDSVATGTAVLAPDRAPDGTALSGDTARLVVDSSDRPTKGTPPPQVPTTPRTPEPPPAHGIPGWVWILGALLVLGIGIGVALGGGGGGSTPTPTSAVSHQPGPPAPGPGPAPISPTMHTSVSPYDVGPLVVERDANSTISTYRLQFRLVPGDAKVTWRFDGTCGVFAETPFTATVAWSYDNNTKTCAPGPQGPFAGTVTATYSDAAGRSHTWSAGSESGTFGGTFSEGVDGTLDDAMETTEWVMDPETGQLVPKELDAAP